MEYRDADSFTKLIDKHLSTVHEVNDREKNVFHPSFMHNNCLRAIIYNFKGEGDFVVTDPKLKRVFAIGHDVHERIQKMLKKIGILEADEVPARSKEYRIGGHCDGVLKRKGKKLALEIKSINSKGFDRALSYGPKSEHINQVRIYMWLLKLEEGVLYYECKNDQRHKAWIVKQDEKTINEVKKKITDAIEYIEKNETPDMCYNGNILECDWCNYKEICKEKGGTKGPSIRKSTSPTRTLII